MTRKTLLVLSGGVIAVAVSGASLGASAAGTASAPDTGPPSAVSQLSDDSGNRAAGGTVARPSDDPTAPAAVSRSRAVQIALARTGGGIVVKVEQEWEHGRPVWSVRIVKDGAELRVDVAAATGEIVRSERKAAAGGRGRDDRSGDDSGGHGRDDSGGHGRDDSGVDGRGGRR
jgi:uncharacterized membrane protein YkoI